MEPVELQNQTPLIKDSYHGRTYKEGKKIGFADGVAALWYILKLNFFCSLKRSYHELPLKSISDRRA